MSHFHDDKENNTDGAPSIVSFVDANGYPSCAHSLHSHPQKNSSAGNDTDKANPISSSKKRSSSAIDPSDIILPGEEDDDDLEIDQSCDQVRRKITAFVNSGVMKVTEFQKVIGVNSNSYGRFMKQRGPYAGCDNQTYEAAYRFFKKRELAGLKMPSKKRKTSAASDKEVDEHDVSNIHLDGEEDEAVPIWDTCDDIRRKINAHLRLPNVTQASFLRALSTSWPSHDQRKLTGKQLNDFLAKTGPMSGNASGVFYAAYVYFEKLRIKQGKKKGKKRLEMEDQWALEGGVPREPVGNRSYIVGRGERPYMDQYGRVRVV